MKFDRNLNSSPEYLQLLLDNNAEGIVACDNNFNITFRNKQALSHHGIPEGTHPGEWSEYLRLMDAEGKRIIPQEELPLVRALKGEKVVGYYLLKRKLFPDILLKYNASPLFDKEGRQIGAICTSEDCSDFATSIARFEAIFEQSPLSIQIVNKDGKTLLVNKAFQNLWDISDDFVQNFILKEYNILEDPVLRQTGQLALIHRAFKGEAIKTEPIFYDPSTLNLPGRARWTCATMYPLNTAEGHLREVVIIHQDITEEQTFKREKEETIAKLEALIKQMPAGVLVVNKRGHISVYNEKMNNMLGDQNRAKEVFQGHLIKSINGQIIRDNEVQTFSPDGNPSILSISASPVFEPDGKINSCLVMATDITLAKRKLNNQNLLDQLKSYLLSTIEPDQVVEKIAAATIPYFADGCMVDLIEGESLKRIITKHRNLKIENLLVVSRNTAKLGKDSPVPLMRVIETGMPLLLSKVDPEVIRKGTENTKQYELVMQIGTNSHLAVPIQYRGRLIGVINFLNTTQRPNFDEVDLEVAINIAHYASLAIENSRLFKEARSGIQLRDDFISIASHELKTPITSLNLQIEVLNSLVDGLDKESEVPKIMRKFLMSTNNQLNRLSRLIDDMLDISRISTGKLSLNIKTVNLRHLCGEVLERFNDQLKELHIEARLQCQKDIIAQCDADRIDQVVTNFMTNAIRYGGRKPIEIIIEENASSVFIKVKDQGRGIYKEDQERIFKRFERAHTPDDVSGLGLGLYINSQIVEEHHGKISLESEPGKGSTFIVELLKTQP